MYQPREGQGKVERAITAFGDGGVVECQQCSWKVSEAECSPRGCQQRTCTSKKVHWTPGSLERYEVFGLL